MQELINFINSIMPTKWDLYAYRIGAIFGCIVGFLFDGIQNSFLWLFVFMVIDYITGIMQAVVNHDLSSKVGFKGLVKKAIILTIAVLFHGLSQIVELPAIETASIFAFALNELCSILENVERMGFEKAIPPAITKLLAICKNKENQMFDNLNKKEEK